MENNSLNFDFNDGVLRVAIVGDIVKNDVLITQKGEELFVQISES